MTTTAVMGGDSLLCAGLLTRQRNVVLAAVVGETSPSLLRSGIRKNSDWGIGRRSSEFLRIQRPFRTNGYDFDDDSQCHSLLPDWPPMLWNYSPPRGPGWFNGFCTTEFSREIE
jgi:hypothetical protein